MQIIMPAVCYDVYVTTTLSVKIIDFNPIGGTTSSLLFTWTELGFRAVEISSGFHDSLAPQAANEPPPSASVPPDTSTASWPLRVVARGGGMQAGSRVACGMPFDMLSLQGVAANRSIISPSPPQGEGAAMSIEAIMAMVEAQSRR